jgi:hypothetical protein
VLENAARAERSERFADSCTHRFRNVDDSRLGLLALAFRHSSSSAVRATTLPPV